MRKSKKVQSLCLDLKSQLDNFERIPVKKDEMEVAKEKRRVLFKNLQEKLLTLSK